MIAAWIAALLSVIGIGQAIAGWVVIRRFTRRIVMTRPQTAMILPAVTVLKPLHGDEPLLEDALASVCRQDYPAWQVVFGVQSEADTALPVVRRLRARFPDCDIAVVVDATVHGPNRKVGNLINMLPAAKHDALVIADSDLHVAPDWLRRLVVALEQPGVGLVTTVYTGLPAPSASAPPPLAGGGWGRGPGTRDGPLPPPPSRKGRRSVWWWCRVLGATQINHYFLPGALLARAMGRQDCLGATMMLRRDTLQRIGGLWALVDHLADDNVLGQRVAGLGLDVALAETIPATTVPEATFGALWRHELRWCRTIRTLVPAQFAASALQYPLVWAGCALLLSGGGPWSLAWLAAAWAVRALVARDTDRVLRLANATPLWLLPVRELMSVAVMVASYAGRRVDWRGHTMQAEGFNPR